MRIPLQDDTPMLVRCYMGEKLIADFLRENSTLQKTSLLLIASELGLEAFPTICKLYTCIHKQQFWSPQLSELRHGDSTLVQAYIDYLLVNNALEFYGNKHSTFAEVTVERFRELNKPAHYYNIPL